MATAGWRLLLLLMMMIMMMMEVSSYTPPHGLRGMSALACYRNSNWVRLKVIKQADDPYARRLRGMLNGPKILCFFSY